MDYHFPQYDFTVNAAAAAVDHYDVRCLIIRSTCDLTVYAPEGYTLRKVCQLDDLRMVSGLLSGLFIGIALRELERTGTTSSNTGWLHFNLLDSSMTSKRMFELLEEGQSYQLHVASIMAFMERLPESSAFRGSKAQAEALTRLATLGEQVQVNNIAPLLESDARHLNIVMTQGLAALAEAGHTLSGNNERLVNSVVASLVNAKALLAFDLSTLVK